MFNIGCWNIWGLNSLRKQSAIQHWINNNKLEFFGLIETRFTFGRIDELENKLGTQGWRFLANGDGDCLCRIIVGWNPASIQVRLVHQNPQWITCEITQHSTQASLTATIIYGYNTPTERQPLWDYICSQSRIQSSSPWVLLGDFNAIMHPRDRVGGSLSWPRHMDDFPQCINQGELAQIPYQGIKLSWHNGQDGEGCIQKKLDWVFGNSSFLSVWP